MEDMVYTVSEVAEILKTNVGYVYKLHRAGLIKFMKLGRLKCRKSTLEAFLAKYDGYDLTDPMNICLLERDYEETISEEAV